MAIWNAIEWPVEQMRTWYEKDGLSVTDIGKKLNRNPKLVWKVCKKHRFQMRPIGSCPGEKNPAWKGGRIIDKDGYVLIHSPNHPDCTSGGYVREHRLVMEKILGRRLLPTEVVHHGKKGKQNNDPDNLTLFDTNAKHLAATIKGQVPHWTEQGKANISRANSAKAGRIQVRPVDWPSDESLKSMHIEERMTLGAMSQKIGCSTKRLAERMHYRGIPIRRNRSQVVFVPRKPVALTASILSPKELDAALSQGIHVHPVRQNEKRRKRPSQKGRSQARGTAADHSTTA